MSNNNAEKQDMLSRFLLAVAIFLTVMYFMDMFRPQESPKKTESVSATASPQSAAPVIPGVLTEPAEQSAHAAPQPQSKVYDAITVKRGQYTAVFTSIGAGMKSYQLNNYYDRPEDEPGRRPLALAAEMNPRHTSLRLSKVAFPPVSGLAQTLDVNDENWTLTAAPESCNIEGVRQTKDQLVFEWKRGTLRLRRVFDFSPVTPEDKANFGFNHSLVFENLGEQPLTVSSFELVAVAGVVPDDNDVRFRPLRGVSGHCLDPKKRKISRVEDDFSTLKDEEEFAHNDRNTAWLGATNRFFGSFMLTANYEKSLAARFRRLPVTSDFTQSFNHDGDEFTRKLLAAHPQQGEAVLIAEGFTLAGRSMLERKFSYYGGPIDDSIAGKFSPFLDNIVTFSWDFLKPISVFLLWILQAFAHFVHNYGIAIILLTVVVKVVLHPLTRKSMKSQKGMQRIQPLLKEIKEKYKKDPQRQQQETMRIFKENGVNPVGGCLPMLLQMPIFFALYGVFAYCFDIRQQPFIKGWIDDLSHPDTVATISNLPIIGDLDINPLPIAYLVLQFFHMEMMPKSTDPQMQSQQKMMRLMPLIFVFIFYSMPAGLVLYFAVQSLLTLAEHFLLKMSQDDTPLMDGGMKTVNATVVPAGTGFKKK